MIAKVIGGVIRPVIRLWPKRSRGLRVGKEKGTLFPLERGKRVEVIMEWR